MGRLDGNVAPIMVAQRSGSIVNAASIAGHKAGYSSSTIYSASKAAVLQLTRSVAMELSEAGVRVNSISPGAIATGIFAKALGLAEGEAADATAESSFISGTDLLVDGALLAERAWTAHQQGLAGMRPLLAPPGAPGGT